MSERIKDLKTGKEVVMLSLYDVANQVGADNQLLHEWHKSEEVETPAPAWEYSGRPHWKQDSLPAWKTLWENHIAAGLDTAFTKRELIDLALASAKETERFARYSYSRSRSYPKMEARQKVIALQHLWNFVIDLGGRSIAPPKAKVDEYRELLRAAKSHLNME